MHDCGVTAVDISADGELVVSGGADGGIIVWSAVTGFHLQKFTLHCTAVRTVKFTADASAFAAGDAAGIVSGWDVRCGALLAAAPAHKQAVADCRWSEAGDGLVSCGYDGYIALLKVRLGGVLGWVERSWPCSSGYREIMTVRVREASTPMRLKHSRTHAHHPRLTRACPRCMPWRSRSCTAPASAAAGSCTGWRRRCSGT
jgi:WD40 repeat protein